MASELISESVPVSASEPVRSERLSRWFEIVLVLSVAVAQPFLSSLYIAFFGLPNLNAPLGGIRYLSAFVQELSALLVLWYVLRRSGRTFLTLGIRPTGWDFFAGLALAAGSALAYYLAATFVQVGHALYLGRYATFPDYTSIFMAGNLVSAIPFFLLNPMFEETVIRGYLMTELSELSGSTVVAIAASVVIQTSYHLYQGWFATTCLFFNFSVLAVYYARTRKLFPVLIAHAVADWWFLFQMFTRH